MNRCRSSMAVAAAALVVALVPGSAQEKPSKPEELVIVRKGTLPIVIAAPHGGRQAVPGVAERKGVGITQFATVRDENTDRLAEALAAELEKALGGSSSPGSTAGTSTPTARPNSPTNPTPQSRSTTPTTTRSSPRARR